MNRANTVHFPSFKIDSPVLLVIQTPGTVVYVPVQLYVWFMVDGAELILVTPGWLESVVLQDSYYSIYTGSIFLVLCSLLILVMVIPEIIGSIHPWVSNVDYNLVFSIL